MITVAFHQNRKKTKVKHLEGRNNDDTNQLHQQTKPQHLNLSHLSPVLPMEEQTPVNSTFASRPPRGVKNFICQL